MNGIERIAKERQRQIDQEGWSEEHDSEYCDFELSGAAICYAAEARRMGCFIREFPDSQYWMWDDSWWKPSHLGDRIRTSDSIRMLEKAGALMAAEIDRLIAGEAPEGA